MSIVSPFPILGNQYNLITTSDVHCLDVLCRLASIVKYVKDVDAVSWYNLLYSVVDHNNFKSEKLNEVGRDQIKHQPQSISAGSARISRRLRENMEAHVSWKRDPPK